LPTSALRLRPPEPSTSSSLSWPCTTPHRQSSSGTSSPTILKSVRVFFSSRCSLAGRALSDGTGVPCVDSLACRPARVDAGPRGASGRSRWCEPAKAPRPAGTKKAKRDSRVSTRRSHPECLRGKKKRTSTFEPTTVVPRCRRSAVSRACRTVRGWTEPSSPTLASEATADRAVFVVVPSSVASSNALAASSHAAAPTAARTRARHRHSVPAVPAGKVLGVGRRSSHRRRNRHWVARKVGRSRDGDRRGGRPRERGWTCSPAGPAVEPRSFSGREALVRRRVDAAHG
jgi:hypothetical protein